MLPVVRVPKIKGVNIDVDGFPTLSGANLILHISVENPNAFPLAMQAATYSLALENKPFTSGQTGAQTIAAKSTGEITVSVHVDFGSVGSWAYSLITKGKAQYALDYEATYLIDQNPVKQKEQVKGALKFY